VKNDFVSKDETRLDEIAQVLGAFLKVRQNNNKHALFIKSLMGQTQYNAGKIALTQFTSECIQ
jgi:hypothetical protein